MEEKELESTKDLLEFLEQSEIDMFENIESINVKLQDNFTKQEQKKSSKYF